MFGDLAGGPTAGGRSGVELAVGEGGECVQDGGAGLFCLLCKFLLIGVHDLLFMSDRCFFCCKVGYSFLPGRGVIPTIKREFATNAVVLSLKFFYETDDRAVVTAG